MPKDFIVWTGFQALALKLSCADCGKEFTTGYQIDGANVCGDPCRRKEIDEELAARDKRAPHRAPAPAGDDVSAPTRVSARRTTR